MLSDLLLSTVRLQVSSTSVAKTPFAVFFDCTFGMSLVQVFNHMLSSQIQNGQCLTRCYLKHFSLIFQNISLEAIYT